MKIRVLSVCLTTLVATELAAQSIQVSGVTRTGVGVRAEQAPSAPTAKSVSRGTKIAPSLALRTASAQCATEVTSSVSAGAAHVELRGTVRATQGYTEGTSRLFADAATGGGTPRFAFRFSAARQTSGRIVVTMAPRAFTSWGYNNFVSGAVTVAGYPIVKTNSLWAAKVTKEFAVDLDSQGVEVIVDMYGRGRSLGRSVDYGMRIDVRFVPGPAVTSYGTSCGHAWSRFSDHATMHVTYQMGLHRSPTLLVLGGKRTSALLPPAIYRCRLLVEPLVVVPAGRTDGIGLGSMSFSLPKGRSEFVAQVVGIDVRSGRLHSTNALEARIWLP